MNKRSLVKAYLGLGANLGEAVETIRKATLRIGELPCVQHIKSASIYQSKALEVMDKQADFFNTVLAIDCTCTAMELLSYTQDIELQFGRTRPFWHAPRTLDIDVLLFGGATVAHPRLCIPHPRLTERLFCLHPLLELDKQCEHPLLGEISTYAAKITNQQLSIYAAE